tara:strand:- start:3077 stop:3538 length:462 start_codon:yes stop_codon:yes gene_type:complete
MAVKSSELYSFLPMRLEDLNMVHELETDAYQFPWTKQILRDCILYNYDSYSVFFGDRIIGYIIAKISYPETHILNLTVDSKFRNNGVGTTLIQFIINDARIRNSKDIILEVRTSNISAQSLYKKLSFKMIGLRKDYYECSQGREDALVLKLEL